MIFEDDVFKYAKNIKSKKEFNIVFLDPPYKDEKYIDIIQILKNKNVFNENHIVIAHREKNSDLKINRYLNIIEKRIYGRSEIFFGRFF